jgi:hypothetical protein
LMRLIDRKTISLPANVVGPSREVDLQGSREPASSLLF